MNTATPKRTLTLSGQMRIIEIEPETGLCLDPVPDQRCEKLRVLVACEYSGAVRNAFRVLGHDAWSCDLLAADTPGLHYQGDVRHLLDGWTPVRHQAECDPDGDGWCGLTDADPNDCPCVGPTQDGVEYLERDGLLFGRPTDRPSWDLMIAHPPCTYLCSSGLHWNKRRPERAMQTEDALDFVRILLDAPIPHIALENPIGCISTRIRPPKQTIQPWQFGHAESKATCLWIKNLPPLEPTKIIAKPECGHWANQTPSGQNKLGPSEQRWKIRSVTYKGIADAMAEQWSKYLLTSASACAY
jgi:hypothetical protein